VLAGCLALAVFFFINALGSLIATGLWVALRRPARRWTASTRAGVLFWLRTLPPVSALLFVAVLLLPAYLIYEPYPAPEAVGFALLGLALYSAFSIAFACFRAVASWRATRRLKAAWLRRAEPLNLEGVSIPGYLLRHPTPVIAVVGVLRPKLFIAAQVWDSLSREELEVALAHEKGHLVARDTLRRTALNFCRDLLPLIDAGRMLERAWAEEAERAADEYAARRGADVALDLAATLIKIARLMPSGVNNVVPTGAFLLEAGEDGLAARVRRLTEMASTRSTMAGSELQFPKAALPAGITGFTAASAAMVADLEILATVHALTECVVKLLT
jgi:Zn-dependent protease with chaperone function